MIFLSKTSFVIFKRLLKISNVFYSSSFNLNSKKMSEKILLVLALILHIVSTQITIPLLKTYEKVCFVPIF